MPPHAAKKILNDPRNVVDEMIDGLVLAYGNDVKRLPGRDAIVRSNLVDGKVALLIGGGSGHEPLFHGFVGPNLADGAACGQVFAAPDPETIYETARAVHRGKGILFLYGNYAGDNMNFDIAAEMLQEDGIEVRTVRVCDDVAAAPPGRTHDRRGIAGDVLMIKIAGGAAAELDSLDEVERVARKALGNVRSMGVAVSAGSIPETGKLTFELDDDEIEIGMGAHGEAGVARQKITTADRVADQLMAKILDDLPFGSGDEVALLINNLGATTMMEMLIVNRRIRQILDARGIGVHRTYVGTWLTVQEMAGFSVTVMKLDDELKHYLEPACPVGGPDRNGAGAMSRAMDADGVRDMLRAVSRTMIDSTDRLTDADAATGDGDHGIGMRRGFEAALERLDGAEDIEGAFKAVGMAIMSKTGGAAGAVFGTFFRSGATVFAGKSELTGDDFVAFLETAMTAVAKRGGVEEGQKTLLDAVAPAARAAREVEGGEISAVLAAAARGADEGVEATKPMLATTGKARSLGERSRGHPDPGAISASIILTAMAEYAA